MSRRVVALVVALLIAGLVVATIYRLYFGSRIQLHWTTQYRPAGFAGGRWSKEITPYGEDMLQEHGLYQKPAVYTYDGKLVWAFNPPGQRETATHTSGNYVGTNKNNVYALDSQGKVRWKTHLPGTTVWTAWPVEGVFGVYVGVSDNYVYALDPMDGHILWELYDERIWGRKAPIPTHEYLYVMGEQMNFFAVSFDGSIIGRTPDNVRSLPEITPVFNGPVICVDELNGWVKAIDQNDGQLLWTYNAPEKLSVLTDSLTTTYGMACLITDQGRLLLVGVDGQLAAAHEIAPAFAKLGEDAFGNLWVVSHPAVTSALSVPGPVSQWLWTQTSLQNAQLSVFNKQGKKVARKILPFHVSSNAPFQLRNGTMGVIGDDGKLYCYSLR